MRANGGVVLPGVMLRTLLAGTDRLPNFFGAPEQLARDPRSLPERLDDVQVVLATVTAVGGVVGQRTRMWAPEDNGVTDYFSIDLRSNPIL